MTAEEWMKFIDELLHDPRTNAVQLYVKLLRRWEKEKEKRNDER